MHADISRPLSLSLSTLMGIIMQSVRSSGHFGLGLGLGSGWLLLSLGDSGVSVTITDNTF